MISRLKNSLQHPLTRDMDIDDPRTTELRREIILNKPVLRDIYKEWYSAIANRLVDLRQLPILELGAGAGFLKTQIPYLITTDILQCRTVDAVADGTKLPFIDRSLSAIVMTNVLHHIPDPKQFFHEAIRCVVPNGKLVMIEPWMTPISRLVYTFLHHEPYDMKAIDWKLEGNGPLSSSNMALPWNVFQRDRTRFLDEFPQLNLHELKLFGGWRYTLSGGVGWNQIFPDRLISLLTPFDTSKYSLKMSALFCLIELKRLA